MTKFKHENTYAKTFKNAIRGIFIVVKTEKNIKVHLCAGLLVLILANLFKFSLLCISLLLLTISSVIVTEMINTAIEYTLDAVYKNKYSKIVGMAKDISAGAVFITTIISVFIGILVFSYNFIN